jgi:cell division protein FtsI (penicillin-binding protein 3)
MVQLQVVRSPEFSAAAQAELLRTSITPALRGGIFDRNGQIIRLSSPRLTLQADCSQIKDPVKVAKALAPLLHIKGAAGLADLVSKLSRTGPGSGQVVLATDVSQEVVTKATKTLFLPGIAATTQYPRSSPNLSLAGSVIGTIDWQNNGNGGLEYAYNTLLAGKAGQTRVLQSPNGMELPQASPVEVVKAAPGQGIELTLDVPLQFQAERALGEELLKSNAISGTAIVMDTRTGEILAQANLVNTTQTPFAGAVPVPPVIPSKNPVLPGIQQAMNNLAVTQAYEPGSVFKVVAFAAALESGKITPETHFKIPGQIKIGKYIFGDAEAHGDINLTATQILAQSSNLGTYQIARNYVGAAGMLSWVQRMGFGVPTGLKLPGESQGLSVTSSTWSDTDYVSLSIGQTDSVTPQQMLDAYNAVANNGVFVAPRLVRGLVGQDLSVTPTPPSASHRVLSPQVASQLTTMLKEVVLAGTGTNAVVPGYSVAGKTGTSQIPYSNIRGYIPGAYNASFVGFAPASNPVLTTIVVINRPTPQYFGGEVAAPVFSSIMSYALHRYNIPSTIGAPTKIVKVGKASGDVTGGL